MKSNIVAILLTFALCPIPVMGQGFSNFVGNAKRIFDTDTVCKGSLYDCVEKEHFLNFLTLFQETKAIPIQDGKPVFLPKNIKPSSIPDSICKVFIPNELYDKDNNWDMYFTPGYYIHKDKHLTLFLRTNNEPRKWQCEYSGLAMITYKENGEVIDCAMLGYEDDNDLSFQATYNAGENHIVVQHESSDSVLPENKFTITKDGKIEKEINYHFSPIIRIPEKSGVPESWTFPEQMRKFWSFFPRTLQGNGYPYNGEAVVLDHESIPSLYYIPDAPRDCELYNVDAIFAACSKVSLEKNDIAFIAMGDISDEEGFSMQNSRLYAISYHKDGRPIDWIPLNESITEDLKSITFSMNGKDIYISSNDKKWIMRDGKFISL